jgi:hypothetical protein
MSQLFSLLGNRAFNSNGYVVPGAQLTFYVSGTTTPAPIYTSSALTTEHANPVVANGAGRFPSIYLDPAVSYRYVLTDEDGASLGEDVDPYTVLAELAAPVGLFSHIATTTIPAYINRLTTDGYRTVGKGAATYFRWAVPMATLPAVGAGENAWWATSVDGARWYPDPVNLNFLQFGAYGDYDPATGTGSDDYPAFLAYRSHSVWGRDDDGFAAFYRTLPRLRIPWSSGYYSSDTFDFDFGTVHWIGDGLGAQNGGNPVNFAFAPGKTGFRTHYANTEEETTRASGVSAIGSVFWNILASTRGAGASTTADGWRLRCQTSLINCSATGFIRHGCNVTASAGGGGAAEGNANLFYIEGGNYTRNGQCGIFVDGADANAGNIRRVNTSFNGTWGIHDSSFLGNYIVGVHADSNGIKGAGPSYAPNAWGNFCSYGGNRYSVVPGQATAASTTTPGTNSAIWRFVEAGAATADCPTWVTGQAWTVGGPYYSDDANCTTTFASCYSEQIGGPSWLSAGANAIGGTHAARVASGARMSVNNYRYTATAIGSYVSNSAGDLFTFVLGGDPETNGQIATFGRSAVGTASWAMNLDANNALFLNFNGGANSSPYKFYGNATATRVSFSFETPQGVYISSAAGSYTTAAAAMPATGTYTQGAFVRNTGGTVSAGKILLGWYRLTTGSAHVSGTDWSPCYVTNS